jgi:hypothetical protein
LRPKGIAVIEDCAQAHFAEYQGKKIGTFGDLGCFSLQQSKQITCGDGGLTLVNREDLIERASLFIDKGRSRKAGRVHLFLGANYRMTELQGTVARAQLAKGPQLIGARRTAANALSARLAQMPGIIVPKDAPGTNPSWWLYNFLIDEPRVGVSADTFAEALGMEGVPGDAASTCRAAVRGGRDREAQHVRQERLSVQRRNGLRRAEDRGPAGPAGVLPPQIILAVEQPAHEPARRGVANGRREASRSIGSCRPTPAPPGVREGPTFRSRVREAGRRPAILTRASTLAPSPWMPSVNSSGPPRSTVREASKGCASAGPHHPAICATWACAKARRCSCTARCRRWVSSSAARRR